MKRWRWISICGFEGMCARVAQWWSIALPRRGSRVRIPSRALKDTKKRHPMDVFFLYVQALPVSNGSNVCVPLRSSQANVPRTFCDVSFSPWWSDFGYFQGSNALIVDVNFLGAVLALRIAGSMDNDLLDKLMQDTWSQFRNFRIPFYNGEKPLHLRTPAESRQTIFFV